MGNIESLLRITKPVEGLNKPCQGNVNGRKYFAADSEGFNVKIPLISQTYTKAVAISEIKKYTFRDICVYKDKMSHEICLNTAKSGSTVESAPQFQEVP